MKGPDKSLLPARAELFNLLSGNSPCPSEALMLISLVSGCVECYQSEHSLNFWPMSLVAVPFFKSSQASIACFALRLVKCIDKRVTPP
jgi:hypothetical protein